MRPRFLIFCIVVLAVCFWFLFRKTVQTQNTAQETQVAPTNQQLPKPSQTQSAQNSTPNLSTIPQAKMPHPPLTTNEIRERIMADWQKPIDFYGKVIDENSNPIVGASIQFRWFGFADKSDQTTTTSDADGLFSLQGKQGRSLEVSISKEEYYNSRKDETDFLYSLGPGIYTPEEWNPVIFHLHKKGQGAQLTTSDYGIRNDFPVLVPRDGTPVNIELLQRKIDSSSDLQISQMKPDRAHWNSATNWSFHMSFSDGGFIETDDAFLFTAPETGYQSTIDLNFTKGDVGWTQFTKTYYIVFGQPQKYGWLQVDANMMQQTIVLKYAINPTGSRNLEPAP